MAGLFFTKHTTARLTSSRLLPPFQAVSLTKTPNRFLQQHQLPSLYLTPNVASQRYHAIPKFEDEYFGDLSFESICALEDSALTALQQFGSSCSNLVYYGPGFGFGTSHSLTKEQPMFPSLQSGWQQTSTNGIMSFKKESRSGLDESKLMGDSPTRAAAKPISKLASSNSSGLNLSNACLVQQMLFEH